METSKNKLIETLIHGLKNALTELEEFQLQLALAKADASDKYEEIKKTLNETIHEAKIKLLGNKTEIHDLAILLEELQLLLILGKASSKEIFNEQKSRILNVLINIEKLLTITIIGAELYSMLKPEIEKFKIKLEILSLIYELKKINIKDEWEHQKNSFEKQISTLKENLVETENEMEKHIEKIGDEIKDAYNNLKKTFNNL